MDNTISGQAEAWIEELERTLVHTWARKVREKTGVLLFFTREGERICIEAIGKCTHASTFLEGHGAVTGLLKQLMTLTSAPYPRPRIKFL